MTYMDPTGLSTQIDENSGKIISGYNDGDNGVYAYPTYEGQVVAGPANYVGETTSPDYFVNSEYQGKDIRNFEIGGSGLYGTLTVNQAKIDTNIAESVIDSWINKPDGAVLTDAEAKVQRNIGIGEMVVGPVAGSLLSYFGPEAFTLGMYVMADGAIIYSAANENTKRVPIVSIPKTFMMPYSQTADNSFIYPTGGTYIW